MNKLQQRNHLEAQLPILLATHNKCKATYQSCVFEYHLNSIDVLKVQVLLLKETLLCYVNAKLDLQKLELEAEEFNNTCSVLFMAGIPFETDLNYNILIK